MDKIIFFPRKSAPVRIAVPNGAARPRLVAVWHRNPANGRLECHWIAEQAPVHGEGCRPGGHDRQAA